jgi:MinD superfamily P-loop ATPase
LPIRAWIDSRRSQVIDDTLVDYRRVVYDRQADRVAANDENTWAIMKLRNRIIDSPAGVSEPVCHAAGKIFVAINGLFSEAAE